MSFPYNVLMKPSILEPEDGDEEDRHHYVSFSASFDIYSDQTMHMGNIPPCTFPCHLFFAEGPQIVRETLATSTVSPYITEEDTDRIIKIVRNDRLPEISANYRARTLAIHLKIRRYMSLSEMSKMMSKWFRSLIIVDELPVVDIDGGDDEEGEGKDLMCSICLKEFRSSTNQDHSDEKIVVRMPCSHMFDKDCLAEWLETSLTCPMCRFVMPSRFS